PTLSICVPSRNRQRYFKETIAYLLGKTRTDVEFVLADNSDDPSVMNDFMADVGDARVKYLASADRTLSMKENWVRCLDVAQGEWITVIGDDDLIDPDLVDALQMAKALKPGLEAFGWSHMRYGWPTEESPPRNVRIKLAATFHDMPRSLIFRRAYRWDDAGITLNSGFSIYHSAISRTLLDRVKSRFGGVYFEHPTIDYDNGLKNAAIGKSFVYCMRPFSILGACPESNSVIAFDTARFSEAVERLKSELGHDFESEPWMRGFPFPSMLGMTATIAQVHQFMQFTYKIGIEGWEPNFARSCAAYCSRFEDKADFDIVSKGFRDAFASWKRGAFLKHFQPTFTRHVNAEIYTGIIEDSLCVDCTIGAAATPAEFY
ncbi:MAG: glycosyltransferase family 2 protein, partial [Rhizobiaceae bacterium]